MAGQLCPIGVSEEGIEEDVRTILLNMQFKEKEIWQKRLFLMGVSDTDNIGINENPSVEEPNFLPESFMRKDDIFYEDLKKIVENGFGIYHNDTAKHASLHSVEVHSLCSMSRLILGLVDNFTTNGICCLAKVLTEDSVSFEKTRSQIKKVVQRSLETLQRNQCAVNLDKIQNQVSELLGDRKNFHYHHANYFCMTLKSHRDVLMKVLNELGEMPTLTLAAMYRKLRVVRGYIPQLCPRRSGWNRDRLVDRVRMLCLEMIDQLGDSDVLPEPLTKAMAVAYLSSKLAAGREDVCLAKFAQFTPHSEAVQKEVFKAIWLLGGRVKKDKIKNVQHVLDPESTMDSKGVKSALKNMLIEFLYECSDMDIIPYSLIDALSAINEKSSRRVYSQELVEEHVEKILNLSAEMKHILLNESPGGKLDEDFADAYMEDLVESDDGEFFDDEEEELVTDRMQGVQIILNDFNEDVQSTRDPDDRFYSWSQDDSSSSSSGAGHHFRDDEWMSTAISRSKTPFSTSSSKGLSTLDTPMLDWNDMERQDAAKGKSVGDSHSGSLCLEQSPNSEDLITSRNRYVAIQDVCDQSSLALYRFMGHMMEEFAKLEGLELSQDDVSYFRGGSLGPEHFEGMAADPKGKRVKGTEDEGVSDAIVRAILKVMPSFPSSELEKIKKFLDA